MRRALAALAVLAASTAAAGAVTLRGGEHGAFTRLVFLAARPLDWSVERDGRTIAIAFEGAVPSLNLSRAYRKITRDRVAAIGWADDTLTLALGCDCEATIVHAPNGALIVDVAPEPFGPPMPPKPTEVEAPRPPVDLAAAMAAPAPAPEPGPPPAIPLLLDPIRVPLHQRVARAAEEAAVGRRANVVLDPSAVTGTGERAGTQLRTRDARAPSGPAGLAPRHAPEADRCAGADGLGALLSADRAAARDALPALTVAYEPGDAATATALLDGYLAAGLGTEAMALARGEGRSDPWRAMLAGVLDSDPAVAAPSEAWRCGPVAALVALAAGPPPGPLTAEETGQIAAFAATLPAETRGPLASAAAETLEGIGARAAAAEIAALARSPAPPDALSRSLDGARTLTRRLGAGAAGEAADDALAVLPTVPDGSERAALVAAIAVALAEDGRLDALTPLLDAAAPATRAEALDAVTLLWGATPPERRAIVAATLLRWRDDAPPAARRRLVATLDAHGLETVAARWRGPGGERGPGIAEAGGAELTPVEAAWLSRDLAGVVRLAGGEGGDAPRADLAGLLAEPEAPGAADTIPGARARLARAREARARIAAVLDASDEGAAGTLR